MKNRVLRLLALLLVLVFALSACGSNTTRKGSRCFWCDWKPFGELQTTKPSSLALNPEER